jgi:glutamate racemase
MTNSHPIGFFDSGVGGLSVWKEVIRCLPHEATLYFADSANCPYGPRPPAEIKAISAAITRFLLAHDSKLIVVACNTASAAALEWLRTEFAGPFVGMEPALKPAAEATHTGHIGVLATAGTFNGYLFKNTAQRHASRVNVHVQVGQGLVEQVEAGQLDTPETESLVRRYLEPMLAAGVDQIALGCTHYPLLMPVIKRVVAGQAQVIDPAQAVARQVERVLAQYNLAANQAASPYFDQARRRFFTTGQPEPLQSLASIFGGQPVEVTPVEPFIVRF